MTESGRRVVTIMCADVVGYSALMARDEQGTLGVLRDCHAIFGKKIAKSGGRIVNAPGDALLAEFPSVVNAVSCGVEIQQELKTRNQTGSGGCDMRFRLGFNLCDVIFEQGGVYGDGVNIASRLESLAEEGGICVSAMVYDAVRGKVDISFTDLGERKVKNIPEPIRVYKIEMDGGDGKPAPLQKAAPPRAAATAPPEVPAIAVLPFQNMSGDPEQDYFSDGICEDIITDLSKLSGLLVIARNTTFTFKGKAINIPEVGKELGVRYLLEGSVRKSGARVRLTAQLIDVQTGGHLWADRYDRDLEDVFAVQDEITGEIVTALNVKLGRGEKARIWKHFLKTPAALELYYRGMDHLNRITTTDNDQAAGLFKQVCGMEPDSPLGFIGCAWTHLSAARYGWSGSFPRSMKAAAELAEKAVSLDAQNSDAYALLGYHHMVNGKFDEALREGKKSVELDPNHAEHAANYACTLVMSGMGTEAVALVRRAIRNSPIYPAWYDNVLGSAFALEKRYEEAERSLLDSLVKDPAYVDSILGLAGVYVFAGRMEEAREQIKKAAKLAPTFTLKEFRQLMVTRDPHLMDGLFDALAKAGMK